MSDIDLTAAIDAVLTELGFGPAEDGALAIEWYRSEGSEKADAVAVGGDRNLIGVILDAALPKIEGAIREQIARDIEEERSWHALNQALIPRSQAARIARGEQP